MLAKRSGFLFLKDGSDAGSSFISQNRFLLVKRGQKGCVGLTIQTPFEDTGGEFLLFVRPTMLRCAGGFPFRGGKMLSKAKKARFFSRVWS